MKKFLMMSAAVSALLFTGCGGGGSTPEGDMAAIELEGKTLLFFDNDSSAQHIYKEEHEEAEAHSMEAEDEEHGELPDMTGKDGKLIVWEHNDDQKIVMLDALFDIEEGNLTHEGFHYIGHFHGEEFAVHLSEEFDPENTELNATVKAKRANGLRALNEYLIEQAEEREVIEHALEEVTNGSETLCNFFILGDHEDHEGHEAHSEDNESEEHEETPHIALTESGKVYVFVEEEEEGQVPMQEEHGELVQDGPAFALDGVTSCSETTSNMVEYNDHGVLVFSAQSQKIYLVDAHDGDFHVHSTTDVSELVPADFTPTQLAAIGEAEGHDHDHDH